MVDKIKQKMGSKGQALVRLCLWAGLVVWIIFYLAFGVAVARWIGPAVATFLQEYWSPLFVDIMRWLVPIWFIFTVLLTIVLISRWVNKKMRGD